MIKDYYVRLTVVVADCASPAEAREAVCQAMEQANEGGAFKENRFPASYIDGVEEVPADAQGDGDRP